MSTAAAARPVPALPEGVRLGEDHGAPAVLVDTPAARAVVHLHGAHLSSWAPAGAEEVLFLSPTSSFGEGAAIRGGVPLVGPWFGPGRHGDRPTKHGWLRDVRWDLVEAGAEDGDVLLTLASPAARTELGATLRLRLGAELSLDLELTAGDEALPDVEAALHTYLALADVREARIEGLGGADYLDNTRGLAPATLPEGPLRLSGPTDRVITADTAVRVVDEKAGRTIVSTPRGTARTVVWNPWDEGAAGMDDLPDDAWPGFVCVEPAVAKEAAVDLAPGASVALGVTYRLER